MVQEVKRDSWKNMGSQSHVKKKKKLENSYISIFDCELNIISRLQGLKIALKFTVVKKDLLHHISPLDETKSFLERQRVVK